MTAIDVPTYSPEADPNTIAGLAERKRSGRTMAGYDFRKRVPESVIRRAP